MQIASTSTSVTTAAQRAALASTTASSTTADQSSGQSGDRTTLSDAAKQKLEAQKQALQQLKQLPKTLSDNAKANAQDRVSRLKKMIQQLRMMCAGNPKQMAKMVAQLAKELQAAVKEYVRAGGSQADVGSDTAAPAADDGSSGETSDAAKSGDQADTADATAEAATAESEAKADEAGKAGEKDANDGDKPSASDPRAMEDMTKRYEASAQTSGDAKARDEFFQDVREVEKKLKQMLDEIKASAKRQHKADDKDIGDSEKALDDIDRTLSSPEGAAAAGTSGSAVNITA
jgi:hypothetical protein